MLFCTKKVLLVPHVRSGTGFLHCGRDHRVSCVQVLWDYQQFLYYVQNYLKRLPSFSVSEQLIEKSCAAVERSCSSLIGAVYSLLPCQGSEFGFGASHLSEVIEAFGMMMSGIFTGGELQMCLIQPDWGHCWLKPMEPVGENFCRQILMLSVSFTPILIHVLERSKDKKFCQLYVQ